MKAFINRDTLVDLIKERTRLTKATDIPEHFQWYNIDGNILTWDFMLLDRVMVDVDPFYGYLPKGEWINRSDALPEEGQSVIAWVKDDAEIVIFCNNEFTNYCEKLDHRVTFWMPKPNKPNKLLK